MALRDHGFKGLVHGFKAEVHGFLVAGKTYLFRVPYYGFYI